MPTTFKDIYESEIAFSELTECAVPDFVPENLKSRITLTESEATHWLEKLLFKGHGKKYLGWKFDEYVLGEDGEEILDKLGGLRVWDFDWEVPPSWWKRRHFGNRSVIDHVRPLWLHLCGCQRGLVIDAQTSFLPFLSIDPDRHKNTPIEEFIEYVRAVTSIFEAACPDYHLSGEVNPTNGSSKLFAWPTRSDSIEITEAKDIAGDVHRRILEATGKNIECFGHNMKNIRLPLHPEKLTVIDSGLLGRATRRKGRDLKKFETHSVAEFAGWRQSGKNLDHDTFFRVIRQCCQNLPEEVSTEELNKIRSPETSTTQNPESVLSPKVRTEQKTSMISKPKASTFEPKVKTGHRSLENISVRSRTSITELRDEPNSFERQHKALLIACRQAKSVINEDDALAFIQDHDLYTGDWADNELRRRQRVRDILALIAKTFDSAKCSGSGEHFEINVNKFRSFTRSRLPGMVRKTTDHARLDEYGVVHEYKRFVSASNDDIACWMAINEFCRESSEQGDGGVPESRASKVWTILNNTGKIVHKWSKERWRLIRDYLHKRKIVFCDYKYSRDDSYCYKAWESHPGYKAKKPKRGLPGSFRDLQKKKKTKRLNTEGVFSRLQNRVQGTVHPALHPIAHERPPP